MRVVTIGGQSSETIKQIIEKSHDNIEVDIYNSITEFVEMSDMRRMTVDRFILLQDALIGDDIEETLNYFNGYIDKHYPVVKMVTLVKSKVDVDMLRNIFLSPYMVHIQIEKVTPNMIKEMVIEPVDKLKQRYKTYDPSIDTGDIISEIIGENEEEKVEEVPAEIPSRVKKKGLFGGLFGKRKRNKKKGDESQLMPLDIEPAVPVEKEEDELPENEQETIVGLSGDGDEEGEYLGDEAAQFMESVGGEGEDYEVDFEVFGGNQGDNDYPGEDGEEEDLSALNVFDELPETLEEDENDTDLIEQEEEENYEPTLTFFDEDNPLNHSNPLFHDDEEDSLSVDALLENKEEIQRLQEDFFSKGLNIPNIHQNKRLTEAHSVDLTEVDNVDMGFTGDLDEITDAYNEGNKKVVEVVKEVEKLVEVPVEVERVVEVEKVVEKVVEVPVERVVKQVINKGGKRRGYDSGARVIIVTGDRKTGVTRTALNLSSHLGKQSNTLYVDFDIVRKGSLLFLGIEDVSTQPEHIQQGLTNIRSVKTLENVAYHFPKGGFDCLLSMYGDKIESERKTEIQKILSMQSSYQTMVIDCPFEQLSYLEDLIIYSEVLVCVESDLPSVVNTVFHLNSATKDDRFQRFLYHNSEYLVTDEGVNEFIENLSYVSDIFSLEDEKFNWGSKAILGTTENFGEVLKELA